MCTGLAESDAPIILEMLQACERILLAEFCKLSIRGTLSTRSDQAEACLLQVQAACNVQFNVRNMYPTRFIYIFAYSFFFFFSTPLVGNIYATESNRAVSELFCDCRAL